MKKVNLDEFRQIVKNSKEDLLAKAQEVGRETTLFLHWSAGHYSQFFDDYHFMIDFDGSIYVSTEDFSTVLEHTWHQNTGNIGAAFTGLYNATTQDLGEEPPTDAAIEAMAQCIAVFATEMNYSITSDYVRTHAEQADLDGYGPNQNCERWDLWILKNGDVPGSGGDTLRGKGVFYQNEGI